MNQCARRLLLTVRHLPLTLLLAISGFSLGNAQAVEFDERLTMPRAHFAGDRGDWAVPIARNTSFAPIPNVTDGNFFSEKDCPSAEEYVQIGITFSLATAAAILALCEGYEATIGAGPYKVWHTQHVVRLPNKNGRAYFMVAQSYLRGGRISLLQTGPDAIDGNDLLKGGTSGGQYLWQHDYSGVNTAGHWNHPGKMEVIGGLLLVSVQDWDTMLMRYSNGLEYILGLSGETILGGSDDAVLFYDIRDPEFPLYLGKITATELGIPEADLDDGLPFYLTREIDSVSLFRSPADEWFLSVTGASGGRIVKAVTAGRAPYGPVYMGPTGPWDRSPLQPQSAYRLTGPYGMNFNSLERLHTPGEKGFFWLPEGTGAVPNISFVWNALDVANSADGGIVSRGTAVSQAVPVPESADTWNTPSVYVTRKGMPVVYAIRNAPGSTGTLVQLHTQANLAAAAAWSLAPETLHPPREVTSCEDSGVGSLRHAIGYGGTITFRLPASCNNTITLASGPLTIYLYDVGIDATNVSTVTNGNTTCCTTGITISGSGASRVLEIGREVNVTLRHLTIRDGFARQGAGLRNMGGTVTLENCRVIDNEATWPYNFGPNLLNAGDGGGILNGAAQWNSPTVSYAQAEVKGAAAGGTLVLRNSTVAGNTARRNGGGIANVGGVLNVERSSISTNRSDGSGGGLYNVSGLQEDSSPRPGMVVIEDSTVAGNSSAAATSGVGTAGIDNYSGGVISLVRSTVAANVQTEGLALAAGINNNPGGALTLEKSIVANNRSGPGGNFTRDLNGLYAAVYPNLISDTTGATLAPGGFSPIVANPLLAPLGNYGGPTDSMPPLAGSPAIEAAGWANIPDQRGVPRPQQVWQDLGAVEILPLAAALDSPDLSNVVSPVVEGNWMGQTTVTRDGVDAAQSGPTADNSLSEMTASVTGPGTVSFWWKLSAEGGIAADRLLFFVDGTLGNPPAAAIEGEQDWSQVTVIITGGSHVLRWMYDKSSTGAAGADAGWVDQVAFTPAVPVVSSLTDGSPGSLRNVIATVPAGSVITLAPGLAGQVTTLTAGALLINKNLTIDAAGLTVSGGNATRVFEISGSPLATVTLKNLTVTGGRASIGGCILNQGILSLVNATVSGCIANAEGGGLYNLGGTLNLTNSTVANNQALYSGGGVFFSGGQGSIVHTTVTENRVTWGNGVGGGFICSAGGGFSIQYSIVAGNIANTYDDIFNCNLTTPGPSLVGSNEGAEAGFTAGPLVGTAAAPLNARLALLGNYGGPTKTMLPLAGSPAVGTATGGTALLATDQRNVVRPQGAARDLGAVEVQPVDPTADTDDDRIPNAMDNCTLVANASQVDSDGDGYGNRCDGDFNNNGFTNSQDYILFRQQLGQPSTAPAYNQADLNTNGFVNSQDYILFRQLLGTPSGPSGLVP